MHETLKAGAVIAAAGSGKRFGEKKQFKLLGRRPLLFHTLTLFLECDNISEIVKDCRLCGEFTRFDFRFFGAKLLFFST